MTQNRIVFIGTPLFARTILNYLIDKELNIVAVVTKPDRPKGRSHRLLPTPVKELAIEKNIELFQPDKVSDPEFVKRLAALEPDLIVVAAFSEILKENVLELPRKGCINVHASLLPKYRGAAPIERCIMAGEKESGVTIMKMEPKLDAGGMLAVGKVPIAPDMTAGELYEVLADIGAEALYQVLLDFETTLPQPTAQDASKMTYAKKMRPEDGELKWELPIDQLYDHFRGVTPKPGAYCYVEVRGEVKRLSILEARPVHDQSGLPGTLLSTKKLIVACKQGALHLRVVKLEGKRLMDDASFFCGVGSAYLKF